MVGVNELESVSSVIKQQKKNEGTVIKQLGKINGWFVSKVATTAQLLKQNEP